MVYIQIPESHRSDAFLTLVKTGIPVICLPRKKYGVRKQHIKLLELKRIPFKKLDASKIRIAQTPLAI
jgi:hypothetical protein